jgi:hypothetical protein
MAIEKEYTLKLSTKQAQANIDELNKSLKLQEDLIEDIEKEIRDYEKQINKTSARDLAQRKSLNDKIQKTKERLKDEKVALKSVNKDRKEANATMKDSTANAKDYSGVLGIIDQKTGGAISGFTNLTKSVGGATKGFNLLKIAIIGTGIGALLIAITAVTAAFTSSEEGQNKFAKILAVVGSVVGNLVTLLSDLGEGIISVFENPKQAIIDLKNLIVENITNRITSLIDTFGFLGSAIKKVFSGDFTGALDDAKAAGSSYIDTMTGVKDTINKVGGAVSDLTNELIREGKIAAGIADQRAKADKLDRDLIIERAKANRDRAELLEQAVNKEKFNLEERIGFLTEAGKIEDEITAKEIAAAQLRLTAKQQENELANSTKEDLLEEANLKAKLIDLETAKLTKAKLVTSQINALRIQTAAEIQAEADAKKLKDEEADAADKLKEDELAALKKQIRDAEAVSEDERRALEIEKVNAHYEELIRLAEAAGLSTVKLKEAQGAAVDKISKVTADNEVEFAELSLDQKLDLAEQGLNNLATILGKESAAGKAAAIGAATISTFQGAVSSYTSLSPIPIVGPALGALAAGAAVASGIAQVKKIVAVKTPGPSVSAPGPSASAAPTLPTIPPAFNVVGSSDTNQLADAIGGQEQQPVQAFVVSSEVTTAQELDRNIIDGASIG